MAHRWMAACAAVLALSFPAAAQVKVYVKFPAGVPAGDKTTMFNRIKSQFTFLGADITFTTDGSMPKDVTVCMVDSFATRKFDRWGDSKKKDHTCNCYRKEFTEDPKVTAKLNAAQLLTAQADTMAHELGHLLCATHNWNAPATREAKDDTGKVAKGNGKAVDLMTNGGKVSIAERGAGRTLDAAAKEQIKKGVAMLKAGKSWDLKIPDNKSVPLVTGRRDTMHFENTLDPTDVLKGPIDIDIHAEMFGLGGGPQPTDFDIGFVSDTNEFVEIIGDDLDDPTGLTGFFLFSSGDVPSFAIAGEPGTPFQGQFFEPVQRFFHDPIAPFFGEGIGEIYWRTVDLAFNVDVTPEPDIVVRLNTSNLAQTHGFQSPQGNVSTFCTTKAGVACGPAQIAATGEPSLAAPDGFVITAHPARACKPGILLYNMNPGPPISFQGGTLCLATAGLRRAGATNSGGTPGGCDGIFFLDMNSFAQGLWAVPDCSGAPTTTTPSNPAPFLHNPGTQVFAQFWGRDSMATGSYLSDGLQYMVTP